MTADELTKARRKMTPMCRGNSLDERARVLQDACETRDPRLSSQRLGEFLLDLGGFHEVMETLLPTCRELVGPKPQCIASFPESPRFLTERLKRLRVTVNRPDCRGSKQPKLRRPLQRIFASHQLIAGLFPRREDPTRPLISVEAFALLAESRLPLASRPGHADRGEVLLGDTLDVGELRLPL